MTGPGRQLTAELAARAIVAAARAYGDHPVAACEARSNVGRRSLTAAADGLAQGLELPAARACAALRVGASSVSHARKRQRGAYGQAVQAARRAVEYAGWRPEAAENVAGVPAEAATAAELAIPEPVDGASCAAAVPETPPQPAFSARGGRIAAERPLRDLLLEALGDGPLNAMSLACRLDRKEMAVSSALAQLAHEGLVRAEAVEGGPRRLVWRLVEEAAA